MFSKEGTKLLKESTAESSYGSITDPKVKTKSDPTNHILSLSSPGILEPSKDAPRLRNPRNQKTVEDSDSPPINPWRTLVTCSCPEPSFKAPISSSGDHSNDFAGEQQFNEEQVCERLSTCSSFVRSYKNAAINLRNSKFIYVFQLLFAFVHISALVMGVLFQGKCIATFILPAYGGLTGIIGIVFTCVWMTISCNNQHGQQTSNALKLSLLIAFLIFFIFLLLEICVFGTMSPSFNQQDSNYCDETFYYYAFYKVIATAVAAVLALLLYLPGCSHYRCSCLSSEGQV